MGSPPVRVSLFALLAAVFAVSAADRCGPALDKLHPQAAASNAGTAHPFDLTCETLHSTASLPSQCVCTSTGPGSPFRRSLPHIVIVGAQKSGSTALFGHLLFHPNFATPKRKELHSFDHVKPWQQDIRMALNTYLRSFEDYRPSKITGEATPSYMLSLETPERLAAVIPDAKFIMILRHPVDRFYSEFHMNLRNARKRDTARTQAMANLESYYQRCLPKLTTGTPSAETISSWIVCMKEAMNTMISFNGGLMRIRASAVMDFGKCISAIADAAASDGIPSVEAVTKCYTKYAGPMKDSERTVEAVASEELGRVLPCVGNRTSTREKVKLLDGREVDSPLMEWGTGRCWPHGSDSNISRDYVVRGLYYVQIVNFLKYIKAENVLILDDTELRDAPGPTMERVWSFVDLPSIPLANVSNAAMYEKFTKTYPTFERTTGWKIDSQYPTMTPEIRRQLLDFYRPHNEQLYAFLGTRYRWDQ